MQAIARVAEPLKAFVLKPQKPTIFPTLTQRVFLPKMTTPILSCRNHQNIIIKRSTSDPLRNPEFIIPSEILPHIETASQHLLNGDTVALPTETVYGLGANTLDPKAVSKVYEIKNRPQDNPLIMHISDLNMLDRLLPPPSIYTLSPLYKALISNFWPGPFTLLFPNPNPPPLPAPQTNGIRMPNHPLALALIHYANIPISAPSANSSGRPSPTTAKHVWNDLKGKEGLGCILDGGDCGVGVESTVMNGLGWVEGGGGSVDILRPGGLGVEEIAKVVAQVDGGEGKTRILVHGKLWSPKSATTGQTNGRDAQDLESTIKGERSKTKANGSLPPSTPGMKYRHYSPSIPVYLALPSNIFPRPENLSSEAETSAQGLLRNISLQQIASGNGKKDKRNLRIGLLHYEDSLLSGSLQVDRESGVDIVPISLGLDATTGAQRLFAGMLQLEGKLRRSSEDTDPNDETDRTFPETEEISSIPIDGDGVDVILIEGCSEEGLGLAVMERVRKAVGGGGLVGSLQNGEIHGNKDDSQGTFWVQV